jgi:hypothetical protein
MWRCPRCGSPIRIYDVKTTVIVYSDGTEIDGDITWEDSDEVECISCDWKGTVAATKDEDGNEQAGADKPRANHPRV